MAVKLEQRGRVLGLKMEAMKDCEGTGAFDRPVEGGERPGEVVK
jgi:hypothetical protein